jgi:Protein of unknown function (DUF3105)
MSTGSRSHAHSTHSTRAKRPGQTKAPILHKLAPSSAQERSGATSHQARAQRRQEQQHAIARQAQIARLKRLSLWTGGIVTGPVTYAQNPPVGGPHDLVWLNCGIYTAPVRNENAVHSLEHGAVWVTYQPSLAEE